VIRDSLLRRLVSECRGFRLQLTVAAIAVATLGASQLALTWLVKRWIEGPLATGDRELLFELVIEGLAIMAAGTVSVFVARVAIASANQRLIEDLRNRALARWLSVRPAGAAAFPTGDLLSRLLTDAGALAILFGTVVRRLCREAVVATGSLVMLFVLDWRLAATVCLAAPLGAWLLSSIGRAIRRRGVRAQEAVGHMGALASEQLHGVTTIKLFGGEAHEGERFARRSASVRHESIRAEALQGALAAAMFVVSGVALVALVWFGTFRLRDGGLPDAALIAFLLYAGQVVEPVRRLSDAHALLQGLLASAARVYEVIDFPDVEVATAPAAGRAADPAANDPGRELTAAPEPSRTFTTGNAGEVSFSHVRFAYDGRAPVLDDVTFDVGAGQHVALVGSTGSGKTTLARMLVAFLMPDAGEVSVAGRRVRDWHVGELRAAVCLVEQEPFLFSGSIADNVRYGSWDAGAPAIDQALRVAGLGPLVDGLPRGGATALSEMGRQLSGGERQRLALARAIVRDPAVLVLDEATGAIDSDTEAALFDALAPWLAGRTVICIAHRLSSVVRFPRAIVLHNGAVAGDGPPHELWDRCPPFAQLFADQASVRRRGPRARLC
jgi:ABC-type multidrug transport system fused ATPase/permease subunit